MNSDISDSDNILTIGAFHVNVSRNQLVRNGKIYPLEPQIMNVLCALAEKPGEVFTRDVLINRIWKVEFGGDESLSRAISILRKTFKKAGESGLYIETIYKRGYRLKAHVSRTAPKNEPPSSPTIDVTIIPIAVLAFEDMSRNSDQVYFSDGISEEIINSLAKLPFLRVTGRTSSFSFRGKNTPIPEIASLLNVTHILEGSVRKQGNQLRITVQLIVAKDDKHIWSETFDGLLGDVFALQETIAHSVERKLHMLFKIPYKVPTKTSPPKLTNNMQAYDFFIQGRGLTRQQDGQDTLPRAIEFLEKAVSYDPKFVEAWVYLATANFYLLEHSSTPNWRENIAACRRAAQRALDINPDIALTQSTLGFLALFDLKIDELLDVCAKVHELEPASPIFEYAYGNALSSIGQSERGLKRMERAISREPFSASWINGIGHPKFALGDFEDSLADYQHSLDLGFDGAMFTKAILLNHLEGSKSAIDFLRANFKRLGTLSISVAPTSLLLNLNIAACYGKNSFARCLVYLALKYTVANKNTQPTVGLSFRCFTLGHPKLFMESVQKHPHPYLGAVLAQLWTPTADARRIRTHKDFPKFAEDIGLVRAWQAYGWPKHIQPIAGTDGSDGQFICR